MLKNEGVPSKHLDLNGQTPSKAQDVLTMLPGQTSERQGLRPRDDKRSRADSGLARRSLLLPVRRDALIR